MVQESDQWMVGLVGRGRGSDEFEMDAVQCVV